MNGTIRWARAFINRKATYDQSDLAVKGILDNSDFSARKFWIEEMRD